MPDAATAATNCGGREEFLVDGLLRPTGEEDRWPHLPSLELSLVPQRRAGQGRDGDRRRPFPLGRQGGGGPGFVVVLQEADQGRAGSRGRPADDRAPIRALVQQPVVEPLVVAVVEPLPLEGPFEVPVRLGDEEEIG